MSKNKAPDAQISDIYPLAINAFRPIHNIGGQLISSYDMAHRTIEREVQNIDDAQLSEFAARSLYHMALTQAMSNYATLEPADEFQSAAIGASSQSKMVQMLNQYPVIGSIELARKTHVGRWNVQKIIDQPVRHSIDTLPGTEHVREDDEEDDEDHGRYKIKIFDQSGILIERKNDIRTHYGGKLLTVIRNCLLVRYDSDSLPDELRDYLASEHRKATNAEDEGADYDYTKVHPELKDHFKGHITNRHKPEEYKPKWAIPLLSTYYTYDVQKHELEKAAQAKDKSKQK